MTRRDYILIADAILNGRVNYPQSMRSTEFREGYDSAAREVGMALYRKNPTGFDTDLIMKNAGVK